MAESRGERLVGWKIGAAVAAFLFLLYLLRIILIPFILAGALAYIANPAVLWLQRRWRMHRRLAGTLVFIVLTVLLLTCAAWGGAILVRDMKGLATDLPTLLHRALTQLLGGTQIDVFGHRLDADSLTTAIVSALPALLGNPGGAVLAAGYGLAALMGAGVSFVLLFYFLISGDRLARGALRLVPPGRRDEARRLAARIDPVLGRYLRGLAAVVLYAIIASWLGLAIGLGLPNALLLAFTTGLLELIPMVGPITAAIIVGIAVLQQGKIWLAVGFGLYLFLLRLSIDQLIGPLVLGRAARLHPTVIIFAFLAGGSLMGVAGLLIAVPIVVSLRILLDAYYQEG